MNKTILTAAIFATVTGNAFAAGSIAVGQVEPNTLAPVANGYNSIVAGANSSANGSNVVVFGRDNTVNADDTTVIGGGNGAVTAGQSTIIGYNNAVDGNKEQTIIGANSQTAGQGAMVIGTHSNAMAWDSVSIGNNAIADKSNAVALGTNSVTEAPNPSRQITINNVTHVFAGDSPDSVVSVGTRGRAGAGGIQHYTRQITNVAAGQVEADSLDAINGSQLFAAIDEINSNGLAITNNAQNIAKNAQNIAGNTAAITKNSNAISNLDAVVNSQGKVLANHEGRITTLENDNKVLKNDVQNTQNQVNINTKDIADLKGSNAALEQNFNNQISNVMGEVAKTGAANAALSALHYVGYNSDDKLSFAAGYGHYKNANAAALGAFYAPNEHVLFSVAGTFGAAKMVNAGVSFRLGKGSEYETNHKGKIAQLETLVNQLVKEVEKLKAGK